MEDESKREGRRRLARIEILIDRIPVRVREDVDSIAPPGKRRGLTRTSIRSASVTHRRVCDSRGDL
jgi:hypothetical protein